MGKAAGGGDPSHLYQRNETWYGCVTVDGTKHRRSLRTTDRAEAERRLEKWLAGLSPRHGTVRHTWAEAVIEWWDGCSTGWKPKTANGYRLILNILDAHFGTLYWDEVDKPRLQQFIKDRRASGASTATINRNLTVVSSMAAFVSDLEGWPDTNPVSQLSRKARREYRPPFMRPTNDCIERIFNHMKGTFGDLARFALLTGMRKDEIVQLQRRHCVDGEIKIYDQKNRLMGVLPIEPEVQAVLDRQPPHMRSPYLFNTRNGSKYLRVTEMWREVVLRAARGAAKDNMPFTPMRFHDLRHEYAIRFLKAGGSIYRLQKLLRHSTIGQTEAYLSYLTPDQVEAARHG